MNFFLEKKRSPSYYARDFQPVQQCIQRKAGQGKSLTSSECKRLKTSLSQQTMLFHHFYMEYISFSSFLSVKSTIKKTSGCSRGRLRQDKTVPFCLIVNKRIRQIFQTGLNLYFPRSQLKYLPL
jgi:hypothetical protein